MGVRGFRVDAAKHMWPGDLEAIQGMVQVMMIIIMVALMMMMVMMREISRPFRE